MINKFYEFLIGRSKGGKVNANRVLIKSNGYSLFIPDDTLWAFHGGEYYEENVIYFLDQIFKKYRQPVFIDIGANCGYYSIKYSDRCKKVFSFEPVGSTYKVFAKNIKDNSITNIKAFKNGLSDTNDETVINLYSSSAINSLFQRNISEVDSLKKIGVESVKLLVLDELVNSDQVAIPDIIKIDVEGAELQVLRGAKETIVKHRPTIILEYSQNTSIDAGYSKEMLLTVLDLSDYKIYGIPENPKDLRLILQKELELEVLSNLIFLPSELDLIY